MERQSAVIAESCSVVPASGTGETVSTTLTSGPARRRTASMMQPMFSTFSATLVVRMAAWSSAAAVVRASWGMKTNSPRSSKKLAATPRVMTKTSQPWMARFNRSRLAAPKASFMIAVWASTGPFSTHSIRYRLAWVLFTSSPIRSEKAE